MKQETMMTILLSIGLFVILIAVFFIVVNQLKEDAGTETVADSICSSKGGTINWLNQDNLSCKCDHACGNNYECLDKSGNKIDISEEVNRMRVLI